MDLRFPSMLSILLFALSLHTAAAGDTLARIRVNQANAKQKLTSISTDITRRQRFYDIWYTEGSAPSNPDIQLTPRDATTSYSLAWKGDKQIINTTSTRDHTVEYRRDVFIGAKRYALFDQRNAPDAAASAKGSLGDEASGIQYGSARTTSSSGDRLIDHGDVSPLRFGYLINGQWIADILNTGAFHADGTVSDPQFGTLDVVTGSYQFADENMHLSVCFSEQLGDVAVRATTSNQVSNGDTQVNVFVTSSFVKYEGIAMAESGTWTYSRTVGDKENPVMSADYQFKNISINTVPDSRFDTTLPPGATFTDWDANTMFRMGEHNRLIPIRKFNNDGSFTDVSSSSAPIHNPATPWFRASLALLCCVTGTQLIRRRHDPR